MSLFTATTRILVPTVVLTAAGLALATPAIATEGDTQVCFNATYDAATDTSSGDLDQIRFTANSLEDAEGRIDAIIAGAVFGEGEVPLQITRLVAKVNTDGVIDDQGAHMDAGLQQHVYVQPGSFIVSAEATACGYFEDEKDPETPIDTDPETPIEIDPEPPVGCGFEDPSVEGGWVATDCFPNPIPEEPVDVVTPETPVAPTPHTAPAPVPPPAAPAPAATAPANTNASTYVVPAAAPDAGDGSTALAHEEHADQTAVNTQSDSSSSTLYVVGGMIVLLGLGVLAFVVYRRRRAQV